MSIFNRVYTAKIAPCSRDWREALTSGVEVIERGRRVTESFGERAFIATDKPTPVVLSHEDRLVVGHVTMRFVHRGWHFADFMLNHSKSMSAVALDRLRHGTPVSIGFTPMRRDPRLDHDDSFFTRHTVARLDEISILRADELPAFSGAKITSILELTNRSPAAAPTADRAVAGETSDEVRPAFFDELERKLGRSVSYENLEEALIEAGRSPLDRHYQEHLAAKRTREPQVITRYGIGRVLAVGGVPVG